jgi:hypothetical protein
MRDSQTQYFFDGMLGIADFSRISTNICSGQHTPSTTALFYMQRSGADVMQGVSTTFKLWSTCSVNQVSLQPGRSNMRIPHVITWVMTRTCGVSALSVTQQSVNQQYATNNLIFCQTSTILTEA